MAGSGGEKTEAPTPKRLEEARKKGQIAKSPDLNGAVVLLVGLMVLGSAAPTMVGHVRDAMMASLDQLSQPEVVSNAGLGTLLKRIGSDVLLAVAPVALGCVAAGVIVNVGQIGKVKPNLGLLKPDFKKINPASGFKQIYGKQALVELAKNLVKVGVVAGIVAAAVVPQVTQLGAMVGVGPGELSGQLVKTISSVAKRAAFAYLLIGLVDFVYQKHKNKKSLKMDKQEVKEEAKQQQLPPEVKGALRRRQMAAARARMMAAVPTADVVVTNPTHYAVALKYELGDKGAPKLVAKGADLIAQRIRELARENGVPLVENPPLARGLYASVDLDQEIPPEHYRAVAEVINYVFRLKGKQRPK
jgi:flagellar biosynthesis protein FlhB